MIRRPPRSPPLYSSAASDVYKRQLPDVTTPAVLLGRQEPRVRLEPKRSARFDDGGDACFLASRYGLTPDPWQAMVVVSWLGRSSSNRLAAGRCGLAVPRQNGKNGILEVVELFKIVVQGRKVLHTAHEV